MTFQKFLTGLFTTSKAQRVFRHILSIFFQTDDSKNNK